MISDKIKPFVLMGLYAKYVWPLLTDLGMKNKDATRLRAAWIPHARVDVLEVASAPV
jgi:hypothetical protein